MARVRRHTDIREWARPGERLVPVQHQTSGNPLAGPVPLACEAAWGYARPRALSQAHRASDYWPRPEPGSRDLDEGAIRSPQGDGAACLREMSVRWYPGRCRAGARRSQGAPSQSHAWRGARLRVLSQARRASDYWPRPEPGSRDLDEGAIRSPQGDGTACLREMSVRWCPGKMPSWGSALPGRAGPPQPQGGSRRRHVSAAADRRVARGRNPDRPTLCP
jgi:hypothetical protein